MSILIQESKPVSIDFKGMMPELSKRHRATHHIHKYPAKLIPHIPNYLIQKYSQEKDIVLDPFCGSGTTLLEAILCNRNALGVELNPIGRLISKVKTTPLDIESVEAASKKCYKKIKTCNKFTIPEFENRDLWFTKKTQNNLAKIKSSIESLDLDQDIFDFLMVSLSSIIYKVSNSEQRDLMPRLSKNPIQANVLNEFLRQLNFNIERIKTLQSIKTKSQIIGNDAVTINSKRKANLIVTSPPYLSAMAYFRTTKLEYYWLNNGNEKSYKNFARKSIHGELSSGIPKQIHHTEIEEIDHLISSLYKKSKPYGLKTSLYFEQMEKILEKMHKILYDDGHFAMIVGNSKILEKRIFLNRLIPKLAEKTGFEFKLELRDRIKFHRLGIKRSNKTNRIYNEHILLFKKY
ncbi:MAG: site-specific DNA-methyltransferase [Nitrosopumilus sp.]|nr:site-specific DNA-methyltransferase [Nitrosopumilus sp.]